MKNDWKSWWNEGIDEDKKKLLRVLAVPLIVLILILVIVLADHSGKKEEPKGSAVSQRETVETMPSSGGTEDGESGTAQTTEAATQAATPEETTTADAFEAENFKRDSVPEIKTLMERYFKARADADPAAMNKLYGGEELTETQLQTEKTKMWNNSKYITGFKNVATYVKPGKTESSWLVYATAEIQFRSVKTTAPMIMWCYVTKDGEGNYLLNDTETLSEDVLKYADEANRSQEVRRLAADVNDRLKAALTEDSDLNSVYGILNAGSPVWESDNQETEAEVKVLDEAESGAESAAPEDTTAEDTTAVAQ